MNVEGKKPATLQLVYWPRVHSCWQLPSDGLSDRRKGTKASFGQVGKHAENCVKDSITAYCLTVGPHWFFRGSEADSFFLLFPQPSYAFAVQPHRWLMQMVCSLQATVCSLLSLWLSSAPFLSSISPWEMAFTISFAKTGGSKTQTCSMCCNCHRLPPVHQKMAMNGTEQAQYLGPLIQAAFWLPPGLSVTTHC